MAKRFKEPKRLIKQRNLWCGLILNTKEKEYLTRVTLAEFRKPIRERRSAFALVDETRNVIKYSNKWLSVK